MPIFEIRFTDGRGASLYTTADVTKNVGKDGAIRTVPAAAVVSQTRPLDDARQCLQDGRIIDVTIHLGAVAYVARHELDEFPESGARPRRSSR